ncbi:MAG: dienelactone hydrolase family protein [Rhodomicrobium sp.]|nr:dienelactone hydrolase family protein [Rhodomicrobium sp.]
MGWTARRFFVMALAASALAASNSQARAAGFDPASFGSKPVVLSNGVAGEPVRVPSNTPEDFAFIIRGDPGKPVTLTGQLFLPVGAKGPVPVVILAPGSGNLGPRYFSHAAKLTSAGIAALAIDPFTARGVVSTIQDQEQFSFAASAYDVLAAAKFLRTRADVDGARIGAFGGSRGGTAASMAVSAPLSDAVLGAGNGLKAAVAGYPWCGVQFRSARLASGAALLILQGDRDDWVNPLQCQDQAHAMDISGQAAIMKLFPGARHSFDQSSGPAEYPNAIKAMQLPTIYMNDKGEYYSWRTGKADPSLTIRALTVYAAKGGFLERGATTGGNGTEAAEFSQEMLAFFKKQLRDRGLAAASRE